MRKIIKPLLLVLLVAFIIIQFIRPVKDVEKEIAEENITASYQVPDNIKQMLSKSCYDCHSNTTHYPWYDKIQPVSWVLNKHVKEGKHELNFSKFSTYPVWRQYKKFKEIGKELKKSDMPLKSYLILHRNAVLSPEQSSAIQEWAANAMKEMEAKYPADSLTKPEK